MEIGSEDEDDSIDYNYEDEDDDDDDYSEDDYSEDDLGMFPPSPVPNSGGNLLIECLECLSQVRCY